MITIESLKIELRRIRNERDKLEELIRFKDQGIFILREEIQNVERSWNEKYQDLVCKYDNLKRSRCRIEYVLKNYKKESVIKYKFKPGEAYRKCKDCGVLFLSESKEQILCEDHR